MPDQHRWAAAALAAALVLGTASCGGAPKPTRPRAQNLTQCQHQWHEVANGIVGQDQDPNPSALAERWTSIVATVAYYETSTSAKNCQAIIENELKAITALRDFSVRLEPYDMTYQLAEVSAAIDLYLHDPLPPPVKGPKGRLNRPPGRAAVAAAYRVLSGQAAAANAELQPGFGQMAQLDLSDPTAVQKAMADLDQLAQDSPVWQACEQALRTLIVAINAQEGAAGAPSAIPSASPTP